MISLFFTEQKFVAHKDSAGDCTPIYFQGEKDGVLRHSREVPQNLTASLTMNTPLTLTCASCNLRYDEPKDAFPWQERKHSLAQLLQERQPDVLATQEGFKPQLYELYELIKNDYLLADAHRSYGDRRMYPALFIHKSWKIQHSTDRWLSNTPTIMGSTSFGSQWPKLATYACLNHPRLNDDIVACSFHLDNVSATARPEQAKVLLKQLQLIYPHAQRLFLMGDANDQPSAPSIQQFRARGFKDPFKDDEEMVTFHDFGNLKHSARIDYIFFKANDVFVASKFVDKRTTDFYSDHFYLSSTFTLPR